MPTPPKSKIGDLRDVREMSEENGYVLSTIDYDIEHTLEDFGKPTKDLPTYIFVHAVKDEHGDTVDYDELWVSTTNQVVPYLNDRVERLG